MSTRWDPGATTANSSRRCENCGSHVTRKFVQWFSDRSGRLHHCLNCEDICPRDMKAGAGRMAHYDAEVHRGQHTASDRNPIFGGGL